MKGNAINYLKYTFLIMAAGWGICLLCSISGIYLNDVPLLYVPYLLGGLSPTIASYFVLKQNSEVNSFREWLVSAFDFRHGLFSYLLVLCFAALFFFSLCVSCGFKPGAPLFAIVFMIPLMLFGGGLEETGWRGILQPELERKLGYTGATVAVSAVWWLWHLPLFYINGVSQYGMDFLVFGFNVLGLSFALAAIHTCTSSTWLCILFHCVVNSLHDVFIITESRAGSATSAVIMIAFSYIIHWVQKRTRLFS